MADAWVKNLGDKISAAEKMKRHRERKLLGFESEEQNIDMDMREVKKRKEEVIERVVEVDTHRGADEEDGEVAVGEGGTSDGEEGAGREEGCSFH